VSPDLFLADLEEKPARLRALAGALEGLWPVAVGERIDRGDRVLLLGMGSSHYANLVAAARLRHAGVPAVAELASTELLPSIGPGTVVIAVSASGESAETLDAVGRLREAGASGVLVVALTNAEDSALGALCDHVVPMLAGEERGGVACRSFQHTLAALLLLPGGRLDPADVVRAAEATEDLLARRDTWLPHVSELLLGPQGTYVAAPAHRVSSAYQSALMLREGPRLPAVGCETGDWSHVDVYLTKTLDYRLLVCAGSRWEPELLRWTAERGSTVVSLGGELGGAAASELGSEADAATAYVLRYAHDHRDDVRLLTETLVAELLAAGAWRAAAS
jgi:fructoselysine-6-P-deglycase FrlB-like protein